MIQYRAGLPRAQTTMSNVPKSKRSLSDLEFYKTALRLRVGITKWLLRDMGAKPRTRTVENLAKHRRMSAEDAATLSDLMDRYNLGDRLIETFPEWWIAERRRALDEAVKNLMQEIKFANAIFPTNIHECYERRLHQDRAIGWVDYLTEELHFIADVFSTSGAGIPVSKFEPWLKECETEYRLLKGWRKADNKHFKRIEGKA